MKTHAQIRPDTRWGWLSCLTAKAYVC